MVADGASRRLLLRAEIAHAGECTISHTVEISESSALIQTDRPLALWDRIVVKLSFPGLLEPLTLAATVLAHHHPGRPGDPTGVTVQFSFRSEAEHEQLVSLLARIDRAAVKETEAQPATYRVLVVEDNGMIRDMFVYGVRKFFRLRSNHSVAVELANDGQDGWNKLAQGGYNLVIVDYYLPIMNGDRLIARMRNDPRFATLPVVAISVGGADARTASLAAGADLFLDKPLVLKDLFSTLELLTAGEVTP